MLVLSHDEVVHGKGSLIDKMPGDKWQKLANLRFFLAWMTAHPGKKLLFQGCEFAQEKEWKHDVSLDWHLLEDAGHKGMQSMIRDLNALYKNESALHDLDHEPGGFEWIDHMDSENSLFSFVRRDREGGMVVVIINATPVPRTDHRIGVPSAGQYEEIFNSDAEVYGGSNVGSAGGAHSESIEWNGRENSIKMQLPPLATVMFRLKQE